MTKKLVSFDDQAEPGEGLPAAVRSELNATYGRAVQSARRDEFANLASMVGGGGQWYFKRQTGAEHHFIRDIGDDYYLSWIIHRQWGNEGDPGMGDTAHYIRSGTVGKPMVIVPHIEGTYAGEWSSSTNISGRTDPPLDYGVGAITKEVTVESLTQRRIYFATEDVDPSNREFYFGRYVALSGMGPDGSDLVTRVVGGDTADGTFLTVEAWPTELGATTAQFWASRKYSSSGVGHSVSWTTPPGATGVGIVGAPNANQGLAAVTIDGDPEAANALPTAAELVDKERYPASILTTNGGPINPSHRMLDTFDVGRLNQYQALAVDLEPGAHTVVLSSTGVQASSGVATRIGFMGFAYCDASTRITDSSTAVFPTRWVTIPQASTDMAYQHRPAGASSSVFAGTSHGYERQVGPLDIVIDGEKVEMQDDETRPFSTIAVTRRSQLFHPEKLDEPSFEMRLTYRAGQSVGLDVEHTETWLTDGWSEASYPIMMTLRGDNFPWVQGDANGVPELLDQKDEAYRVIGPHSAYIAWHPSSDLIAGVIFPAAEQITDGFSLFGGSAVRDRVASGANKITKVYIGRRGDISLGDVWSSRATYFIGRLPDGPSRYLPVE